MGEAFIVRKGGVVSEQAATPTITEISVTTSSITFTLKNNDTDKAIIRYRLDDIDAVGEIVELAADTTSSNITITGLEVGGTEYTVFATANVSGKVKSETASLAIETELPELAIQWNQSTDTVTRLADAVGLSRSNFDTLSPWKDMRRCMVNDDRSINYYIDPADPTKIGEVVNTATYTTGNTADYTGSHGQVMVEIPKFFYKTNSPSSNVYQWYISMEQKAGYSVHPAFVTGANTRDKIYMSAFEASAATSTGTLRSISGTQPLASRTLPQMRTQAQARGTGWQLQTYQATQALQVLYLIEYADFDTQTTIGRGVVDMIFVSGNDSQNTGRTISLGNASGKIEVTSLDRGSFASGFSKIEHISYRGIENWYGNLRKWVDGLNIEGNYKAYIANDSFASDTFTSPYTLVGTLLSTNNTFVTDILFPDFLPTAGGGASTSHLHDTYQVSTGNRVADCGGYWDRGTLAGAFFWGVDATSSTNSVVIGSRIQIL